MDYETFSQRPYVREYPRGKEWKQTSFFKRVSLRDIVKDDAYFLFEQQEEERRQKIMSHNPLGRKSLAKTIGDFGNIIARRRFLEAKLERDDTQMQAWFEGLAPIDRENVAEVIGILANHFTDINESTSGVYRSYLWINAIGSTLFNLNYHDVDLLVVSDVSSSDGLLCFRSELLERSYEIEERSMNELSPNDEDEYGGWLDEENRKVITLRPRFGGKPIELTYQGNIDSPLEWVVLERKHTQENDNFREQCAGERVPLVYLETKPSLRVEDLVNDEDPPLGRRLITTPFGQKVLIIDYEEPCVMFRREEIEWHGRTMMEIYGNFRARGFSELHPSDLAALCDYFGVKENHEIPLWIDDQDAFQRLVEDNKRYGGDVKGQLVLPFPKREIEQKTLDNRGDEFIRIRGKSGFKVRINRIKMPK